MTTENEVVQLPTGPSLADDIAEMRKNMAYADRLKFYECPFEDDSPDSYIHFIHQKDGSLDEFNKLMAKGQRWHENRKRTIPPIIKIDYVRPFKYVIYYEGCDRAFQN